LLSEFLLLNHLFQLEQEAVPVDLADVNRQNSKAETP
jgi:hypothetical protein